MLNNQRETLEDRLAKRRRLRNKRFLDKNSVDESEVTLINNSPTTRSLDRKSSKRMTPISSGISPAISMISTNQRKSSTTTVKNPELPPIENSSLKQNHLLSNNKTNSTPLLPQVTKHQSLEPESDKQVSSKSFFTNEQQQQNPSHKEEKPAIFKETVVPPATTEKSNPIHENSYSHHNEKPVSIKETVVPLTTPEKSKPVQENSHSLQNGKPVVMKEMIIPLSTSEKSNPIRENCPSPQIEKPVIIKETVLPLTTTEKSNPNQENSPSSLKEKPVILKETVTSVLPPTTIEKPNSIPREARGHSIPNRIKNFSSNFDLEHPSSHPQSTTDRQQKQFSYPPFHSKPIARTTSEQIVSMTKRKHEPIDLAFAKQNSLALSYLFNKRMIDAELARTSSSDSEQSQRKTVWD